VEAFFILPDPDDKLDVVEMDKAVVVPEPTFFLTGAGIKIFF
jgi:hypothetical protein